jgi:hypothetical protein
MTAAGTKANAARRPVYLGRCFLCSRVIVGDPSGFKHVAPMPRNAGTVEMAFGFGSRHDICAFDGLICDDCAERFKAAMLVQTRERLSMNRARLRRQGVRFATKRDLARAFATPFTRGRSSKRKPA